MTDLCCDCKESPAVVTYVSGARRCGDCSCQYDVKIKFDAMKNQNAAKCEECGENTGGAEVCKECCEHSDMDEGHCLICGDDRTEWLMCAAYDRAKSARYGD